MEKVCEVNPVAMKGGGIAVQRPAALINVYRRILNQQLKETPKLQTQSCDIKGQRQRSIYNKINIVYTCVTHLSEEIGNGSRHCQATFTRDVFDFSML